MTMLVDSNLPEGFMLRPGWLPMAEADALFARLRESVTWEQHEGQA